MESTTASNTRPSITGGIDNTNQESYCTQLLDEAEEILRQHRVDEPELYRMLDLKKKLAVKSESTESITDQANSDGDIHIDELIPSRFSLEGELRGAELRRRIQTSHQVIRQYKVTLNADIIPRTQVSNKKCSQQTVKEEQDYRADIVSEQIRVWRSLLPQLIKRFSKIRDPRNANSVKHKLTVLMLFGLFSFIFHLSSRREMNRELTGPVIFEHLRKLFPEIDSIPHADTLARLLERINPKEIETIHINLIRDLIKKKKFKKLLLNGCLPITIDGTQKFYRDGLSHDTHYCERVVGNPEDNNKQQYVYTIEANITFRNGLTIPLMTEFLYRENNKVLNPTGKQDSETTAFERMALRLKSYFPKLKMILFADAMYATQPVMSIMNSNHWEYIIVLPKKKLTDFSELLDANKPLAQAIPNQRAY